MSNDQAGGGNDTTQNGEGVPPEVENSPVLQGHSALNDPNLSGSTTEGWSGETGPDLGRDDAGQGTAGGSTGS